MQHLPSSIGWAIILTGAAMFGAAAWQERGHWLGRLRRAWRAPVRREPA
jgi:hypothetical protein